MRAIASILAMERLPHVLWPPKPTGGTPAESVVVRPSKAVGNAGVRYKITAEKVGLTSDRLQRMPLWPGPAGASCAASATAETGITRA
jgi:hypothetical protein